MECPNHSQPKGKPGGNYYEGWHNSLTLHYEATYKKLWPGSNFPLQPSDAKLCTYTGENFCILGSIPAHVPYADQECSDYYLMLFGSAMH